MRPNTNDPTCNPICNPTRFVGCDVGKSEIVVFDTLTATLSSLANRPEALALFAASLDKTCLLVCEATGGYEDGLLAALLAAGIRVHRADARKVKAFIRSYGILGKSDAIDARALARYGEERHHALALFTAPDPDRERLQTLVLTRADLVAERGACANRLAAPGSEPARPFLEPVLACLDEQLRAIDHAIAKTIRANKTLQRAEKTLRSIKGLAGKTAAALIALMPELGQLDRRKAAALAGLAPHPNQSGTSQKYRRTKGGRPQIKAVLFMAALSASRHEPTLKATYQRLIANGKKPIVALTAVMRRIIVIANARLKEMLNSPVSQLS